MDRNLSDLLGPSPQCIPIDEMVVSLEAPAGSEMRRQCEHHLASCANCSTELALYRQFESAQPSAEESEAVQKIVTRLRKHSPAVSESWWSRIWKPRVLAPALAVAAAAIALIVMVDVRSRLSPPEVKIDDATRSSQLVVIGPIGEVQTAPAELQWKPVAGAANYQVRIREVDRTELWQSATSSTSIAIPETVKHNFTPSKRLLWDVTAMDTAGKTISVSGPNSFVLKK
jgi:hypothetical protein